jgi:regulator of protease activity HflC (stomatin/prohibitin superfamily)
VAISLNVLNLGREDGGATGHAVNIVALVLFALPVLVGIGAAIAGQQPVWILVGGLVGFVAAQSPKIVSQWERVVLLRLGRYVGLRGPGLFWIVPFVEVPAAYVDQRVITTPRKPRSRCRTIDTP